MRCDAGRLLLLSCLVVALLVSESVALVLSTQEALLQFQAWNEANAKNRIANFTVTDTPDDERSRRLSHFSSIAFPDSLQTVNAANVACREGTLLLNGEKVGGAWRVQTGDRLSLSLPPDRRTLVPEDPKRAEAFCNARLRVLKALGDEQGQSHSPLRVLYEDDCMAIVCKPAGIHTMSWAGTLGKELCMDDLLPLLLQPPIESADPLSAPLPRHRLDARVAGPVVVAKTRRALVELGRSFEQHVVEKEYRAILVGDSAKLPPPLSAAFLVDGDVEGRESRTEVTVLAQTPCSVDGILTDVKLAPITGRRHQLRRHCAEVLGAPILGDDLHTGGTDVNVTVRRQVGLYLYCRRVAVPHPMDDNRIVSAEIPEPRRFARHREKAKKGWLYAKQNPVKVTSN